MGQAESAPTGGGPPASLPSGDAAPGPRAKLKPPLPDVVWLRLTQAMHYIETTGIDSEGLYRVPGLASRVSVMSLRLSEPTGSAELDMPSFGASLDDWCSVVKQTFNRFAPLAGYENFDPLCAAAATGSLPTLLTVVSALDPVRLERVEVTCRHLVRISLHSDKNKMSLSNLGKMFCGVLVRPPDELPATDLGRELKIASRTFAFANLLLEAYHAQEINALAVGLMHESATPPLEVFRMRRSSFALDDVSALFSSSGGVSHSASVGAASAAGAPRKAVPALRLAPPSPSTNAGADRVASIGAAEASPASLVALPSPSSASGRSLQARLSTALSSRGSRLASPLVLQRIDADSLAAAIDEISRERSTPSFSSARSPLSMIGARQQQNEVRASNQHRFFPANFSRHKRASNVREEAEGHDEEEIEAEGAAPAPASAAAQSDADEASLAEWEAATSSNNAQSPSAPSFSAATESAAAIGDGSGAKRPSFVQKWLRRASSAASSKELFSGGAAAGQGAGVVASPTPPLVGTGAPSPLGVRTSGRPNPARFDASLIAAALASADVTVDAAPRSLSNPIGAAGSGAGVGAVSAGSSRPSIQSTPAAFFSASAGTNSAEGGSLSEAASALLPGVADPGSRPKRVVVEGRPSLAPGIALPVSPAANAAVLAARAAMPSQERKRIV